MPFRPRERKGIEGGRTCKPNSVCRLAPAGRSFIWATRYRGARATYPEVGRAEPARVPMNRDSFPIWSCSVWGLPCPAHYCPGGALLPHLFTLTPTNRGGMFSVALSVGLPLKASLPDVIRHTALWSSDFPPPPRAAPDKSGRPRGKSDRPVRLPPLIIRGSSGRRPRRPVVGQFPGSPLYGH